MLYFKSASSILLGSMISSVSASSYVAGDVWSTLVPEASIPDGVTTDYLQTFGIAIEPIVSSVALTSATPTMTAVPSSFKERAYSKIITSDRKAQGSVKSELPILEGTSSVDEVTTYFIDKTLVTTIFTTVPCSTETSFPDSQYSDSTYSKLSSDINSDEFTTTIRVVTTFLTTKFTTVGYSMESASSSSDDVTTTLTITPTTYVIVTRYGSLSGTTTVVKSGTVTATATVSNRRSSTTVTSEIKTGGNLLKRGITAESCLTQNSLAMTLNGTILTDSKGRIGSIVSNRQFQFDGPPPQAGAIFAAGWYIDGDKLGLSNTTTFYRCLSGNFYNVYDQMIGEHCEAVQLNVVDLVAC